MAIQLLALLGHFGLLLFDYVGFLFQSLGRGEQLALLLVDLRSSALELGFAASQLPLELGDLPLPIDELLPERHHGDAMLVLAAPQDLLLVSERLHVGMERRPRGFQLFLALADEGADLGDVVAQLLPRMRDAIERRAGPQL